MMKHASQIQFGRPERAVLNPTSQGPDKWALLDTLTKASEHYDLSHRTLGVLKALLSFLPSRDIPTGAGAVVFPSNQRLSDRLSGMPVSTLRRHLAHLVRAGIVDRHDSPNGKRYARHIRGSIALAFGFDLTPLANLREALEGQAAEVCAREEELTLLRTEVMVLQAQLLDAEGQGALTHEVTLLLRRKPNHCRLHAAKEQLSAVLDTLAETAKPTVKMSTTNAQNERHIQTSDKYDLDSEDAPTRTDPHETTPEKTDIPDLHRATQLLTAHQAFYPQRIRGWHDLIRQSEQIAPMLGIDQPVLHQAKHIMGPQKAAVVVLCILERMEKIKSPGAYLRHLSKMAQKGLFSVSHMLNAIAST